MKDIQHTPGPWHAEKFCIWAGDCYVAGTSVGQGDPEQRANALLIAAAPDLLSALESAAKLAEGAIKLLRQLDMESGRIAAECVLRDARAAIARATGNQ